MDVLDYEDDVQEHKRPVNLEWFQGSLRQPLAMEMFGKHYEAKNCCFAFTQSTPNNLKVLIHPEGATFGQMRMLTPAAAAGILSDNAKRAPHLDDKLNAIATKLNLAARF